jgi:glycosyltransferase involved in cell wall biosynthesis
MRTILINGYFLCRRLTGVERYALEITSRLDQLCRSDEIALIVPAGAPHVPRYKNIKVIRYGKMVQHIIWQMVILQFFLLSRRRYIILDFGNTCLPLAPGIIFLHDIYCELFPDDFTGFRDRLVRLYNRWQYRLIARKAKKIGTVSHFSKNQMIQYCGAAPEKIAVIYSSWNHFDAVRADYSVFDRFPPLASPFYFSLGSLSKRKNIKWIVEYAAKHPDVIFAISGTSLPTVPADELCHLPNLKNIILLGYLSDSETKALMEKCRAFLLPSYYEGFGLTPLEALSCGAQAIVAAAASLPEIYGKTVHYIDPFNTDVDLDTLLAEPVEPSGAILRKYSYDTSAKQAYDLIRDTLDEDDF